MDDLLFKNIPAEGFDPDCGFTNRVSNPTPSRTSASIDDRLSNPLLNNSSSAGYSDASDRLSNATPTRRASVAVDTPHSNFGGISDRPDEIDRMSSATPTRRMVNNVASAITPLPSDDGQRILDAPDALRASNPTPTRRSSAVNSFEAEKEIERSDDSDSRASNPTPTRRRESVLSEPPITFASLGVEVYDDISRASNPSPTRRNPCVATTPVSSISSVTAQVLNGDEESRMSVPTPSRRTQVEFKGVDVDDGSVQQETLSFASVDSSYGVSNDNRASNPTTSNRKRGD